MKKARLTVTSGRRGSASRLQRERVRRRTYRTREEARQDVFDYIEMFYNPKAQACEERGAVAC